MIAIFLLLTISLTAWAHDSEVRCIIGQNGEASNLTSHDKELIAYIRGENIEDIKFISTPMKKNDPTRELFRELARTGKNCRQINAIDILDNALALTICRASDEDE